MASAYGWQRGQQRHFFDKEESKHSTFVRALLKKRVA